MAKGHITQAIELSAAAYSPAAHAVHDDSVDAVEYLPTGHWLQVVAALLVPLSVIEPAAHSIQSSAFVDALLVTYFPAAQSMQDPRESIEYLPATHTVHVVAPAL